MALQRMGFDFSRSDFRNAFKMLNQKNIFTNTEVYFVTDKKTMNGKLSDQELESLEQILGKLHKQ